MTKIAKTKIIQIDWMCFFDMPDAGNKVLLNSKTLFTFLSIHLLLGKTTYSSSEINCIILQLALVRHEKAEKLSESHAPHFGLTY